MPAIDFWSWDRQFSSPPISANDGPDPSCGCEATGKKHHANRRGRMSRGQWREACVGRMHGRCVKKNVSLLQDNPLSGGSHVETGELEPGLGQWVDQ